MSGAELALTGPGGEPVDLWRTIMSHGLASLPPLAIDTEARTLTATLLVGGTARTVRVAEGRPGFATVSSRDGGRVGAAVLAAVRHLLRLDEDLSGFYTRIADDPDLTWATRGAGRLIRSATVFEEVVKTICTTNCAWSATVRMVGALVEHLGVSGRAGRAFPTPAAMAEAGDAFYRDTARAGYRGAYLVSLARSVSEGQVDIESLARTGPQGPDDDEVAATLLALPGVGPYAVAHIMLLLGRYSRLVLDSWTRPKFARLTGADGSTVPDAVILDRFAPYGPYAGLAFWLYLTADWVEAGERRAGP